MPKTKTPSRGQLRGTNGQSFDLEAPQPGVQPILPQVAVGVLIVAVCALGALYFWLETNRATAVLAAAVPIEQGAVVERSDLELLELSTEDDINSLRSSDVDTVVGRVALTDVAPGTILTPEHVTAGSTIEAGEGVVGLALSPGGYPSLDLRPGDRVDVVLAAAVSGPGGADAQQAAGAAASRILVEAATVVEVAPIGNQGQLFVAVSMTEDEAAATAAAASAEGVRLIEVAGG